jgi:uncharacterized protein with GYD domain
MTVITKAPTKEQIVTELAEVRARVEQVKRQAKELGMRTTQLYAAINKLPEEPKRIVREP